MLSLALLAQEPAASAPPESRPPEAALSPIMQAADSLASGGDNIEDLSTPVQIALILTVLALAPALLMTVTSFTRIIIVLSFVRRALSVPELPPNQVLLGISFFLTLVIMNPVIQAVNDKALQPYLAKEMKLSAAAEIGGQELGRFLAAQTRDEDLLMMVELTATPTPETADELPLRVLIPAFALSELRTAFQMGFLVYLPFLIVDLVVASVLLSMGMFMLPPVIISTPFKILLFVLVDGWDLVVRSLFTSFQI
jgi:flagellar biosynthetic protein FliP